MRNRKIFIFMLLAFFLCLTQPSFAQMQSENYRIPTSVFSGGGAPAGSTNYQTDATLGQSSPLMDPSAPPSSSNYNLEPGFWYTVAVAEVCECDLTNDGKCDMQDWLLFGEDWGHTDCNEPNVDCECDLNTDGKCDMQDWLLFGEDWGRTDCP